MDFRLFATGLILLLDLNRERYTLPLSVIIVGYKFCIQLKLAKRPPPPSLRNLNFAKLQSKETMTELCEKVTASINKKQYTITDSPTSTHTKLAEAINTTAPLILGKVGRDEPLIGRQNTAFISHTSNPSRRSLIWTFQTTYREIKKDVASAKEKYILLLCNHLNQGCMEKGGTSGIWTSINRIKAGLSKVKKSNQT